jgi:hypothetical protein
MAMTAHDELESVAEPVLRQIRPKRFHWDAVDPDKVIIRYDRPSDTLLVHLFGRGRPSISVPVDRYLYVMVDPDTESIIGIHIEGFLAQAVKEHPRQIEILDYAELSGMTVGEVRTQQREILGSWRQLAALLREALTRTAPHNKARLISLLLGAESERWGLPGKQAA